MTASIVGWAHTPFGKFDTETVESLVVRVATEALCTRLSQYREGCRTLKSLPRWGRRPMLPVSWNISLKAVLVCMR